MKICLKKKIYKLGKQKQNDQKKKKKKEKNFLPRKSNPRPKQNELPISPREVMLQKAQHCAPKRERIYPLQFLEGVQETLCAQRRVFELSQNIFTKCFPKKHTSSFKQKRIEIHTPYLVTFSSQWENKNFDPPHRYQCQGQSLVEKTSVPFSPREENN